MLTYYRKKEGKEGNTVSIVSGTKKRREKLPLAKRKYSVDYGVGPTLVCLQFRSVPNYGNNS
jgi:hypothetical protein